MRPIAAVSSVSGCRGLSNWEHEDAGRAAALVDMACLLQKISRPEVARQGRISVSPFISGRSILLSR